MGAASWRARADAPPNKGGRYPPEVLTPPEVAAIIGQCSPKAPTGIRNRALLMLLYRSGLRVSEVLALRAADVNLSEHTVRVLHGKGDKATTRGFHPSATDAIARWTDTRRQLGTGRGPLLHPGRRPSPPAVRPEPAAPPRRQGRHRQAGPPARPAAHLRLGTRAGGHPVTTISALLGHSGIATTARYLAHLTNRQAVTALAAVDLPEVGP